MDNCNMKTTDMDQVPSPVHSMCSAKVQALKETLGSTELPSLEHISSSVAGSLSETKGFFTRCFTKQDKRQSYIEFMEYWTGIRREKVLYPIICSVLFYLIYSQASEFLSIFCGVIYPAFATVKSLVRRQKSTGLFKSSPTQDDLQDWATYWCVFSAASFFAFLVERFVRQFPAYWFLKTAFYLYLYRPETNGAPILYDALLLPSVSYIDDLIQYYYYVKTE
uniref:Receptor expression-enhancing protein n=1 Tax=Steinernema glaseri TaxID=37863 RepID=A0A1I8AMJ3_9BILA